MSHACTSCRRDSGHGRQRRDAGGGRRARHGARRSEVGRAGRVAGTNLPRARARTRPRTSASSSARGRGSAMRPFSRAFRRDPRSLERGEHVLPDDLDVCARDRRQLAERRSAARYARASLRASSVVGGDSSPHALRTITASNRRAAATGLSLARRSTRAGTGAPRSRSLSSSTRAGSATARPRKRPSTKSTERRSRPENGERRNANRSRRPPPSHS